MRRAMIIVVIVLSFGLPSGVSQEADIESLIAERQPEIQEQINRVYSFYRIAARDDLDEHESLETLNEFERLKNITEDKDEIVQQLAIFVATTVSEEDLHWMAAGDILERLNLPASIPIRVLAPYLDAENEKLHTFAETWFWNHDSHQRPPLGSVNYYHYMQYARNRLEKNEEIPAGFINYIYEKHPGKALLVFAYANRAGDAAAHLRAIHKALEANRQGRERTPVEIRQQRETKRQFETRRQQTKIERSEILLAEHIVSNAVWLKENDFTERFQAALPEASAELAKLAEHEQWWARLYVAYIMRQHPELRQADVMDQLSADSNPLVRETASSAEQ